MTHYLKSRLPTISNGLSPFWFFFALVLFLAYLSRNYIRWRWEGGWMLSCLSLFLPVGLASCTQKCPHAWGLMLDLKSLNDLIFESVFWKWNRVRQCSMCWRLGSHWAALRSAGLLLPTSAAQLHPWWGIGQGRVWVRCTQLWHLGVGHGSGRSLPGLTISQYVWWAEHILAHWLQFPWRSPVGGGCLGTTSTSWRFSDPCVTRLRNTPSLSYLSLQERFVFLWHGHPNLQSGKCGQNLHSHTCTCGQTKILILPQFSSYKFKCMQHQQKLGDTGLLFSTAESAGNPTWGEKADVRVHSDKNDLSDEGLLLGQASCHGTLALNKECRQWLVVSIPLNFKGI